MTLISHCQQTCVLFDFWFELDAVNTYVHANSYLPVIAADMRNNLAISTQGDTDSGLCFVVYQTRR